MSSNRLMQEIRELNLTYLLLAQQMAREDRAAAVYRLGVSSELADMLGDLTPGQISKMAGSNLLLCRFRFDDSLILDMLTSYSRDRMLGTSHAAILLAGQAAQELAG